MIYPLPKHLKSVFKTSADESNEFSLSGNVKCGCGSNCFSLLFVGEENIEDDFISSKEIPLNIENRDLAMPFYLFVNAKCCDCGEVSLIYDNRFHGWNGFVAKMYDRTQDISSSLKSKTCKTCNALDHSVKILIQSQGKEDFATEASDLDINDWGEGFARIKIDLECLVCGNEANTWLDDEAM